MNRFAAALALGLVLCGASAHAQARRFAPWPEAELAKQKPAAVREPESSPVKLPMLWGLWFYRNAISPLDGVRCGLYPTCSGYATDAVRKHGALAGGFLAADRLIHEASVRTPEYPIIEKFDRRFLHDPVEANDRLFRRGPAAAPTPAPPAPSAFAVGDRLRDPPAAFTDPGAAAELASSLAESGDRYRAVGEFRRAAFLSRDDARASALLVEGGWVAAAAGAEARRKKPASWSAGNEAFDEADRLFEDADRRALKAEDLEAVRRAGYAKALAYLSRGYLPEATRRFKLLAVEGRDDALAADAAWLGAWSELSRDLALGRSSRASAKDRFEPFLEDPERAESAKGLILEASDENWRDCSPTAAAVMSFVLPGSGYVYAGRPMVGLGALVLNGAFIAGTVLAFRDGNYPLAAILLSMETGWYVGGATGAALEVVDRNELGRRKVERKLRKKYMGTVWPGGAAVAILF